MWRRWLGREPEVPHTAHAEPLDYLLRRLQWTILRPLAHRLGGDERSFQRGPGVEVTELREYQPGDDVRLIDWNVSARTDRPYVREAHVERALDVWLVVDVSASVDWGTADCLKRDRVLELAAVAGQLLGRHGHRIGALLFADRPLAVVPPAHGRAHIQRLLGAIRDEPGRPGAGVTDLGAALRQAAALIKTPALVLVVSDWIGPAGWQTELQKLAQRHEVVAVRVHDPRESELPDVGWITVEDPETGAQLGVDTRDRQLRERFAAAAQAQVAQLHADFAGSGVDELEISTAGSLLPPLVRFLNARRLGHSRGVRAQTASAARVRGMAGSQAAARPA